MITSNKVRRRPRGRFHGVGQIIRFNWPRYVFAIFVVSVAALMLVGLNLPSWIRLSVIGAGLMTLWWSAFSLVVSYWVYDMSKLMRWEWLFREFPQPPEYWLNLHAGLDESTASLREFWPEARGETADIYSAAAMTEKSILRARTEKTGVNCVDYQALPYAGEQFDRVFIFFAAHELREPSARQKFFAEIRRVLTTHGDVIIVEHLRDAANFLAYGPGFLHFHSHCTWLQDIRASELHVARELSITPFVHVFFLKKIP